MAVSHVKVPAAPVPSELAYTDGAVNESAPFPPAIPLPPNTTAHAAVIGAGIIGLTTAISLQREGFATCIYTKCTPYQPQLDERYVSPRSGAHWYSFADDDDTNTQTRDKITFDRLRRTANADHNNRSGVTVVTAHAVVPRTTKWRPPWWTNVTPDFTYWTPQRTREFVRQTRSHADYRVAYSYKTVMIDTPKYLRFLYDEFVGIGGRVILANVTSIRSLTAAPSPFSVVVNCAGLAATEFADVTDTRELYAVRGRTVIVLAPDVTDIWRQIADEPTYVLPRGDGTVVLGGSYEHHNTTLALDDLQLADAIVERCADIVPSIRRARILRHECGLRPYRTGGCRLEREERQNSACVLIHNYGHGGAGVQSSWGCAQHVIDIVRTIPTSGAAQGQHNKLGASKL